jgi:hypothetical protein
MRILYFTALMFAALALGPALAHLFALPNKIGMSEADYFVAQQIYRGWAWLGLVVYGALLSALALSWALRRDGAARTWALVAFLCIVGTQGIFWTWTYPANRATQNWTTVPADWQRLRTEWEYSHATSAALNLLAVAALALSLLAWKRQEEGMRDEDGRD